MMDATERDIFTASVRKAASGSVNGGLDDALEAIGFSDALEVDEYTAVSTVFEAQGAAAVNSSALGAVIGLHLGLGDSGGAALIISPIGSAQLPARPNISEEPGTYVHLRGIGLCDLHSSDTAMVVSERDGVLCSARIDTEDLLARAIEGLDPGLELCEVDTELDLPSTAWKPASGSWDMAVAAGRLAIAHELLGAMREMLALARQHALERVQFGQPISNFQAVRHRLAETLVAIEAADSALEGAWIDRTPFTAQIAKAVAGNSSRVVRRHCQQVLAGIGFTTEHDLHRYIRRTMVLDALLGDARSLTEGVGRKLLAEGRIPNLLPL